MKKIIKINNIQLETLIRESISKYLLNEEISSFGDYNEFEESDEKKETGKESERRDQVENFFDKPGVNNAQYAYKLFNVTPEKGKDTNAMKNARSQFEKDLHHTKNSNGYPYSFTSAEINSLESMISNNQLAENFIKECVKKTIKKFIK